MCSLPIEICFTTPAVKDIAWLRIKLAHSSLSRIKVIAHVISYMPEAAKVVRQMPHYFRQPCTCYYGFWHCIYYLRHHLTLYWFTFKNYIQLVFRWLYSLQILLVNVCLTSFAVQIGSGLQWHISIGFILILERFYKLLKWDWEKNLSYLP